VTQTFREFEMCKLKKATLQQCLGACFHSLSIVARYGLKW